MDLFDELQAVVDEGRASWKEIFYFVDAMIDSREDDDYCEEENCNEAHM